MPDATLSRLAEIAGEAGRIAHNSWRGEFNVWEKSPGHKVCDVDIAVNDFLREALTALAERALGSDATGARVRTNPAGQSV